MSDNEITPQISMRIEGAFWAGLKSRYPSEVTSEGPRLIGRVTEVWSCDKEIGHHRARTCNSFSISARIGLWFTSLSRDIQIAAYQSFGPDPRVYQFHQAPEILVSSNDFDYRCISEASRR